MQLAARSYAITAAALITGTLLAVTPTTSSVPSVQVRPAQLTSADDPLALPGDTLTFANSLLNMQADELSSDTTLIANELASNASVVAGQESFESDVASAFPSLFDVGGLTPVAPVAEIDVPIAAGSGLGQVFDRLVDVNNLSLSTSENLFNSLIGADNFDPAAINASLLIGGGLTAVPPPMAVDSDAEPIGVIATGAPFLSGQIGGLEGITGNSLDLDYATINYLNTELGISLPNFVFQDVVTLGDDFITFNNALVADELAFNTQLLNEELAAEAAAFGGNEAALNGSVDRMINIDNLSLSTEENSFNSLIGAEFSPADITQSLLTGTTTDVFDTGDLGGLQGIIDQNLALSADLAGLTSSDITSAFAPGAFDTAAFTAAIDDLYDVSAFSNLTPDLATLSTDLGTIFTSTF
ncbi:MAG: hypothetical protein WB777_10685 [Mycobacterium sp.]